MSSHSDSNILALTSHWSLKFNLSYKKSSPEVFAWTHQSFINLFCQGLSSRGFVQNTAMHRVEVGKVPATETMKLSNHILNAILLPHLIGQCNSTEYWKCIHFPVYLCIHSSRNEETCEKNSSVIIVLGCGGRYDRMLSFSGGGHVSFSNK